MGSFVLGHKGSLVLWFFLPRRKLQLQLHSAARTWSGKAKFRAPKRGRKIGAARKLSKSDENIFDAS